MLLKQSHDAAEVVVEKLLHVEGCLSVHVRNVLPCLDILSIVLETVQKMVYTRHTMKANRDTAAMTRTTRFHVDELPETSLQPKHLTKQQFGRRLYQLMLARGWNQSELARQAGLPRDSISTYIRGVALPTPKSLKALADALDMQMTDILPNVAEMAVDEDHPSIEIKVSPSAPNTAWLRVNRLVSLSTATQIAEMLAADQVGAPRATSDGT